MISLTQTPRAEAGAREAGRRVRRRLHCALGEVRIGTRARTGRLAIRLAVVVACADDPRGRGAPRCLSSSGSVASAGALPPFFPIECGGHCALVGGQQCREGALGLKLTVTVQGLSSACGSRCVPNRATHTRRPGLRPRCSPSATAPLWRGLARRLAAARSGAWLLGAVTSVRHSRGRHTQYVLLVLLHAPLQGTVWEESRLERLAGERAQAVAVAEHRKDGGPLV